MLNEIKQGEQKREKKIAEIRETVTCFMGAGNDTEYDLALNTLKENAGEWIPFLLSELDRIQQEYAEERAAHNAHVAELCRAEEENRKRFVRIAELVSERERLTKENRKLRERLKEEIVWQDECLKLEEQLQSAQQEIERLNALLTLAATEHERESSAKEAIIETLREELDQVKQERDKLIEGLRWYGDTENWIPVGDGQSYVSTDWGARARETLKSIGIGN